MTAPLPLPRLTPKDVFLAALAAGRTVPEDKSHLVFANCIVKQLHKLGYPVSAAGGIEQPEVPRESAATDDRAASLPLPDCAHADPQPPPPAATSWLRRRGLGRSMARLLGGSGAANRRDGPGKSHSPEQLDLFQHVLAAYEAAGDPMTEKGYLGNDPELLSALESANIRETTLFLLESTRGETRIAGGMAKLVLGHQQSLQNIIGKSTGDVAFRAMKGYVVEQNLRIWMHDDGYCMIGVRPGASRCHELAGTNGAATLRPRFSHRSPGVCIKCDCYAVTSRNVPFWRNRLQENKTILNDARRANRYEEYAVCRERIRQSEGILKKFGDDDAEN